MLRSWENRHREKGGSEGCEDSFRQSCPLSWLRVLIVKIHSRSGARLSWASIKGWVEQLVLLFGPGKWWGCKWIPAEGNKRRGDRLVQPDSRVGAPLGHVNWSHLLPIPARSSCYHCQVEGRGQLSLARTCGVMSCHGPEREEGNDNGDVAKKNKHMVNGEGRNKK